MQISFFDGSEKFVLKKPVRLIELFAGYGSQHFALQYLRVNFESWKISEWAIKSIQAYKDAHFQNDNNDYSRGWSLEEIIDYLFNKGISSNYNEPMTKEQISRLKEPEIRRIYNNIIATHNLVSVCNIKANDLEITDTDKYDYIMTYSFPCQDLSSAGVQKGMEKGSGTRSGLLWEVERILDECENLPQILIMENVPEVIGSKNIYHFAKWLKKLDELGYKSKYEILNAKDFGIPQNRNRCFMISVLGNYYYEFPEPEKLNLKLKDILEVTSSQKYCISQKGLKRICEINSKSSQLKQFPFLASLKAQTDKNIKRQYIGTYQYAKSESFMNGKDRFAYQKEWSDTLQTSQKEGIVYDDFSIRKFTPKECFRLMGIRDEDFEKIRKNQTDNSLYHLAGDSIVTNVLMAIFRQML